MEQEHNPLPSELSLNTYYLSKYLESYHSRNNSALNPQPDDKASLDPQDLIQSSLRDKIASVRGLLVLLLSDVERTKSLETSLLSYLDQNIIKVENHLLEIDFWQNHNLHKDVMQLRAQMQQQLFQLEQEKVRIQVQINNQMLQLSKDARSLKKELDDLEAKSSLFKNQDGRSL